MSNRSQKPYYHNRTIPRHYGGTGLYPILAGDYYGETAIKAALIRHGMKGRPAAEYYRAVLDVRINLCNRAKSLTGLDIVEWSMNEYTGCIMASQYIPSFHWGELLANVLEVAANKGRQGQYR